MKIPKGHIFTRMFEISMRLIHVPSLGAQQSKEIPSGNAVLLILLTSVMTSEDTLVTTETCTSFREDPQSFITRMTLT